MKTETLSWPPSIPRVLWRGRKCPLCRSFEFRQAEAVWLDGVFALLGLRAVRCVNCWRRYYSFAKADSK